MLKEQSVLILLGKYQVSFFKEVVPIHYRKSEMAGNRLHKSTVLRPGEREGLFLLVEHNPLYLTEMKSAIIRMLR